MAGANLPAKKYTKTSPTVTRLSFEATGNSTRYIDIGLALSKVNRRFARSGVYYYVNSIEVYNNSTGVMDIHTLPDTYMTKNAWNFAFKKFQKMNALVDTPRGKWHDFRVYMSDLHRVRGSLVPSLYDVNAQSSGITSQETDEYSVFTSADDDGDNVQEADNFYIHMLGDHNGSAGNWVSVGAIKSYNTTRTQVSSAGTPITHSDLPTDPLLNMFDMSSEEFLNDIAEELAKANDMPPYPSSYMVGELDGHMQHVARIGTEIGVGRVGRAAGFCAPFGLICIDPHGLPSDDNYRIVLNLAAGTYHGVYAERA